MLVVAVDTATPAVSAALVRVDDEVTLIASRVTVDARAHGELLGPHVADVLRGAGRIDAIVVGLGPGPFTGLRVGLVTAATMGQALGIPVYGVCSLDGLGSATIGRALVATDARRKEIYWAVYQDGRRVDEPAVGRPADVAAMLAPGIEYAVGEGAAMYASSWDFAVRSEPRFPDLRAMVALAGHQILTGAPGSTLTPLYLRRPDAVEPSARTPAAADRVDPRPASP